MKKFITLAALLATTAVLTACGGGGGAAPAAPAPGGGTPAATPTAADSDELTEALTRIFPTQMANGGNVRVAVIRNLPAGDHTQQFLDGARSEGEALGFEVSLIVTDGDSERAMNAIAQAINAGYDGLIISHAELGYAYDSLLPARQAGIEVVTFDTMPYRGGVAGGELLEGVTSTAQDDIALAELSLGYLVDWFPVEEQPIRVWRAWFGPGIPPLDRRQVIFDRLVADGVIEEVTLVAPIDLGNPRGGTRDVASALLPAHPAGTVDAVWGSFDELAKGVLDAFLDAGRTEIPIMGIDVSNDNLNLMREHSDIWVSTAAVDPTLIGTVNMRILAAKMAGEPTPDYYEFLAHNIRTADLRPDTTMANLHEVVDGWGRPDGMFDGYDWMQELRALTGR